MAEEKKEPWLNYLALTTVILAVCATFSTFKGGGYSTARILNQSLASDSWAQYQSKSIKGYLYEMGKDKLELEVKSLPPNVSKDVVNDYRQKIEDYGKKISKYEGEKKEIYDSARKIENNRDEAQKHGQVFGLAVIFLQIAILLCSIAALMKKKPLWILGSGIGLIGIFYFIDGFFLFPWFRSFLG